MDIFEKTYYGNNIGEWLFSFLLIVASLLVGRMIYWFSKRWLSRLTQLSRTNADDILVDIIEEPLVASVVLLGSRYALLRLNFSEKTQDVIAGAFLFMLVMIAAWTVERIYTSIHKRYLVNLVSSTKTDLDDQLMPILLAGMRFIIFALGVIIALDNAGYEVTSVVAGLGIGGLAFALAAQDTVSNLFGSITVFLQRPFKVGDRIQVAGKEGYVRQVGLRTTRLEWTNGESYWIPNKLFISDVINNFQDGRWIFSTHEFRLHRSTSLDALEKLIDLMDARMLQVKEVVWAKTLIEVGDYYYSIKVNYGVKQFVPGEGYFDHLQKKSLVQNDVIFTMLHLLEDHHYRLAMRVEIKTSHEHYANGSLFPTIPASQMMVED